MRWLPSQRQMETFESGTLGSGGKFVHFFLPLFVPCYFIQCVTNWTKPLFAALPPSGLQSSLCQSTSIVSHRGRDERLKVLPIVPVWWLKPSHQLRQCLAKCMVSCDWILGESVLSCCLYRPFFFSLCGICCHYLFMCFRRNPTARAFVPALSDLLRGPYSGRSRSITDLSAPGTGVYLTAQLDEWKADICHDLTDIKILE